MKSSPIEHYLKQPQRLVQAITDPRRIEAVDDSVYRLSMRPLQFMGIHIEPMADFGFGLNPMARYTSRRSIARCRGQLI
jgi:hypothetical protein